MIDLSPNLHCYVNPNTLVKNVIVHEITMLRMGVILKLYTEHALTIYKNYSNQKYLK